MRCRGSRSRATPRADGTGKLAASIYDYRKDEKRQNAAANTLPGAGSGGPGTLADGSGTGWTNLAAKGTWRPAGMEGPHIVDFGAQLDRYTLRYLTSTITGNWLADPAGALASNVQGKAELQSLYVQDAWTFAPRWKTVLGLRAEHWRAVRGRHLVLCRQHAHLSVREARPTSRQKPRSRSRLCQTWC